MHIKIIEEDAAPGTEAIWMYQTLGAFPVPLPNEDVRVYGKWYTVISRDWIADAKDLHALVYVRAKPWREPARI